MKSRFLLLLFLFLGVQPLLLSAQEARRIVSLASSVTNNLCLLGVGDRIVGRTQFCTVAGHPDVPVVADAVNVNIEKVVSLRPDLVIASGLTHPRIVAALQKMGIRTVHWRQPADFNEICTQFEELGRLCGKSAEAARCVKENRARLAGIRKSAAGMKIFMEQGTNPLFTVLPDSFVNDYIVLLGGKNICDDLKSGAISRELVLLRNPDAIVIVSMGNTGAQEQQEWKRYNSIGAVKNGRIYLVDAEKACVPTPETFVDVLEKLSGQLAGR